MRIIISRICGLLNRQIAIYRQLIDAMLVERKALLVRDIEHLHDALEKQQELVDEIHDIMKDYEEEVENLFESFAIPRHPSIETEQLLKAKLGRDARPLVQLSEKLKKVIERAKQVNRENQRIIEVSNAFFKSYFRLLTDIRSQAFGYTHKGVADRAAGRNVAINHRI
ncbi:MAG: flagellar protein FlgN [candidate division KSB1 bacterium]|nr:flagellar protein FlgN [candidate division KSB1 bacterium]MDQ7062665.1 flagellar protein FlgN [candidate division KSB1 bacterium]